MIMMRGCRVERPNWKTRTFRSCFHGSRSRWQALLLGGILTLQGGCGNDRALLGDPTVTLWSDDNSAGRRFLVTSWDTLAVLGGTSDDTLLTYPHRIASHPNGIYVYDDGMRRLLSLDDHLGVRAVVGRGGAGPGEFSGVRDLIATPTGNAAVLDRSNNR